MRFAPERTSINRMGRDGNPKMTMPTRFLLEKGQPELFQHMQSCRRVLDFGAGKSFDAQLLVERCELVEEGVSYDPYPREGFEDRANHVEGFFNLVFCNFVLNVLETEEQRRAAVMEALFFVRPGGYAMFSVRSDSEINKKNYSRKTSHDTFISKTTKEWYTVQKGYSEPELAAFIGGISSNGQVDQIPLHKKPSRDCTMVLFRKRPPQS
jgi:hypothetical protein